MNAIGNTDNKLRLFLRTIGNQTPTNVKEYHSDTNESTPNQ
jgi:hypothetical protein